MDFGAGYREAFGRAPGKARTREVALNPVGVSTIWLSLSVLGLVYEHPEMDDVEWNREQVEGPLTGGSETSEPVPVAGERSL
jgi:hypothetical protein